MSDMVETDEIFDGKAALITAVSEDLRTAYFRYAAGTVGRFISDADITLIGGDTVIINGNRIEMADPSLWNEPLRVGIVRKILDKQVLVEDGASMSLVSKPAFEITVGNTVDYSDLTGISSVLAKSPIRSQLGSGGNIDGSQYLQTADGKLDYADFGGFPDLVRDARRIIEVPLLHADQLAAIGAKPIRGVLFTGPPGTGKTHLARIIASQSQASFYLVSGPEIISKWMGDSEDSLRSIFEAAAAGDKASIIFFDEIDSIAADRSSDSHEASKRLVAQLLTLMDGFDSSNKKTIVIAATNRIDDIDPALLRPGRFDRKIAFRHPSHSDRTEILAVSARDITCQGIDESTFETIADQTDGWSAADVTTLWTEAALIAASESRYSICAEDLVRAVDRLGHQIQGGQK